MNLDRVIAVRNRKTVYRNGDRCIKLFNEGYSKADILNEALNQARIEETELNIPRIHEVTTVNGKWAIISEYIKGKTLARLMEEAPEKKKDYIELLVDIQMQVHKETCPLLNRLRDKIIRKLADTDFDATTRYDLHNRLEALPRENYICHGDFSPSNIIIAEDGVPYIIDWSHATVGNKCADVARSYLLFRLSGDADAAEFYLDEFIRKSEIDKKLVYEWLPIVAAALTTERSGEDIAFLAEFVNAKEYK